MLNKKALAASLSAKETDSDFKQTVLLLHGDGTNGAQNNTFTDGSTNNFSITRNGNTTQGTFSPFSLSAGEWSNYFDGTGDYLATSSSQVIPSGNFTIEAFVYVTDSDATQTIVSQGTGVGDAARTWMGIESSSGAKWAVQVGGTQAISSTAPTLNTWHYVAMVYNGSTIKMYLNGSEIASANSSTNASNTTMKIGSNWGNYDFFGYISNVRISNTARTIGSTPTSAFTADANTVFLGCRSNRFVDISTNAYALTATGTPSIQAFSPFAPSAAYDSATNGGSGYFDGSGDYLTVANNTALQFGTGDFTIEAWIYPTSATYGNIVSKGSYGGGGVAGYFEFRTADTNKLQLYNGNTNSSITTTVGFALNTWNHVAVTRSGSTIRLFLNGTTDVSQTDANAWNNTGTLAIGAADQGSFTNLFVGYLSGVRILKGTAQYTANFTPPTSPLTAITNTQLLCNFTNAGIIDSTAKNVLETVGNAQIDTGTKKFGTGSLEFDGTGDYLVVPKNIDISFGSGSFTVEGFFYYNGTPSNQFLFDFRYASGGLVAMAVGSYGLDAYIGGGNRTGGTVNGSTWYHFALVRNGSTCYLFLDGTQVGSTFTDSTNLATGGLVIGARYDATQAFPGFIDDLRITKGVARYTANFTVPTKAFADQ
jgi:hypothetical protein